MKGLLLVLATCLCVQASGIGFKGELIMNQSEPGIGVGFLGLIDCSSFFSLYPNIDFWYNSYEDKYWEHDHWVYYQYDENYEVAFNFDMMFRIPARRVEPFLGFGIAAPVFVDYGNVEIGFNMFGGMLFPLGRQCEGLFEFRGKAGRTYSVFKASFGIVFLI